MKKDNKGAQRKKIKFFSLFRRKTSLIRDEKGVTAVEFGILAFPFFLVLAAIAETALVILVSQTLDNAVDDAVRLIRTGQAQHAGFTANDFRAKICKESINLLNCDKIKIYVREISSFNDANPIDPLDSDGDWDVAEIYDDGVGSSIIIAEAYYKWPMLTSFVSLNMFNAGEGYRLLGSARVWRNEPF